MRYDSLFTVLAVLAIAAVGWAPGPVFAGTLYDELIDLQNALDSQYGGYELIDFQDYPLNSGGDADRYAAFGNGHRIGPIRFESLSVFSDIELYKPDPDPPHYTTTGLFGTFLVDGDWNHPKVIVRPGGQGEQNTPRDDDDFLLTFDQPVPGAGIKILDNTHEASEVERVTFHLLGGGTAFEDYEGGNTYVGFVAANPDEFVIAIEVREGSTSAADDDIGFDDIVYGLPGDGPRVIGEVGKAQVSDAVQDISFDFVYQDPVVFVSPVSYEDAEIARVRITDVRSDGFSVKVHDETNTPMSHDAETLHFMVLEAGQWQKDGHAIEVGHVTAQTWIGPYLRAWNWYDLQWTSQFVGMPLLFSQVQSENDPGWVGTRQWRHQNGEVVYRQFALEALETVLHTTAEKIGWMLVDSQAPWASTVDDLTDAWAMVEHSTIPVSDASFLAQLATWNDSDNAHLRYRNLGSTHVDIRIEEDSVFDPETIHPEYPGYEESINLLVFEPGYLLAEPPPTPGWGQ